MDGDNSVETKPIFKIVSPLETGVKCKQNSYNISHHAQSMLSHYLWNALFQICDKS